MDLNQLFASVTTDIRLHHIYFLACSVNKPRIAPFQSPSYLQKMWKMNHTGPRRFQNTPIKELIFHLIFTGGVSVLLRKRISQRSRTKQTHKEHNSNKRNWTDDLNKIWSALGFIQNSNGSFRWASEVQIGRESRFKEEGSVFPSRATEWLHFCLKFTASCCKDNNSVKWATAHFPD